jgi:formyl-CoA transferase
MTLLRRPVWFDGRRDDQPLRPPPTLGEHSAEILRELGFDSKAMAAFKSEGVI